MTNIIHLPTKQIGKHIGFYNNKRAYIVKTANGEEKYWTRECSKMMEESMGTKKVMLSLSGSQNKSYSRIERVFDTVDDAATYLHEMMKFEEVKSVDKTGTCAQLTNGWWVTSNHKISDILDQKPPKNELDDFYPFDLRGSPKPKLRPPKQKTYNNAKMIQLKELTDNPRKARVVLRQLVRSKKIIKPKRWEWAEGSEELNIVKEAISNLSS